MGIHDIYKGKCYGQTHKQTNNYSILSLNFDHQGENNQLNHQLLCHDLHILVQSLTPGESIRGATLPVSQLEQGGAWRH